MAKVFIEESNLTAIGEAIRSKTGKTDLLSPASMATEIESITTGGGGDVEEIVLRDGCVYACTNSAWNVFFDKVRTENISDAEYMFMGNKAEYIPFDINLAPYCTMLRYVFQGMSNLKSAPLIKGNLTGYGSHICSLFNNCNNLREIPYDYFHNFGGETFWTNAQTSSAYRQNMFQYCYSLRKLPDIRMLRNAQTSGSRNLYYNLCGGCYSLDEIVDLPVIRNNLTSNFFSSTFSSCSRIKNMMFETNEDGSPIKVTWKNQTIDLSSNTGVVGSSTSYVLNYNSGITADKAVSDDTTYQALKNDPDWYATVKTYSRYNHDSAVNTINSLPDCSAGSGNTLKLLGGFGAGTDGGAINTLTEEEIAVATAKGWTISFV